MITLIESVYFEILSRDLLKVRDEVHKRRKDFATKRSSLFLDPDEIL